MLINDKTMFPIYATVHLFMRRFYRFRPNMAASSPVVSLSSDTIQQVGRENLATGDLMEALLSMKNTVVGVNWPYNELESPGSVTAQVMIT